MSKKEKIIYATLELAAEYGLKSLSMAQIAEKVGIKKAIEFLKFLSLFIYYLVQKITYVTNILLNDKLLLISHIYCNLYIK